MPKSPLPLIALSEAKGTQALERFAILRPVLEGGVTQAQVAQNYDLSPSSMKRFSDE